MPAGRPPIPPEEVAHWQELYLELLALGKTEVEINAVEDMPTWDTRWHWKADKEFSARRSRAQSMGIEKKLKDAEDKAEHAYDKACDDAASPQLVAAAGLILKHAQWKASKLNREDYGEKIESTVKGDKDSPLQTITKFDPSNLPDDFVKGVMDLWTQSRSR